MFLISTFLLAVALAVGVYGVYLALVRDRDPVAMRLRDLRTRALAARPVHEDERPSFLMQFLALLGGFLPAEDSKESLQSGLVRAGIREATAPAVFLGAKALSAVVCAVGWVAVNFAMARPIGSVLFSGFVAGVVGFYLPTLWLYMKGE